jgi:hypothetical protein
VIANPQTGVKLIEAYRDVLTPQLVKGYETEVKYGIAYIIEEKEAFCKYLKNNQFARDAIMKGDYKNLAIDYIKNEYTSVLKFVVRHRSELPADVIDTVLKYAVSDKSLSDQVRNVIKNRNIDAETAISIINGIGKNVKLPDKVLGVDVKQITDLIRGNLPGLLFAPSESSKAPGAGENELQAAQPGEQSQPGANADESVLKAARDRMQAAYKKYIDANAPAEGPLLEEYKNAVDDYKKLTGSR